MARMEPRAGNWKKRSQALPNLQCFLGLPSPQIQLTSNNHEQHFKDHNSPIHPFFFFFPFSSSLSFFSTPAALPFLQRDGQHGAGGVGVLPNKKPATDWVSLASTHSLPCPSLLLRAAVKTNHNCLCKGLHRIYGIR